MNAKALTRNAGLRADIRKPLELFDKFGATIGISTVVPRVNANKNVAGFDRLSPGQRTAKKNCVSCRHVSNWDLAGDLAITATFWNFNRISYGRPAKDAPIDFHDPMLTHAKAL